MQTRWVAVCQWCGKRGAGETQNYDRPPMRNPVVPGKCKSHPSGNPNMEHGAQWQKQ